jgi:predicted MPP superfamily phosphohydrolase
MNRNFIITFILILLSQNMALAQSVNQYSFIVAGHTYGAHARQTLGLHPPFMEKLPAAIDSSAFALFLTGDLVNQSNKASWDQVKTDLASLTIPSYYIMGNHDINSFGYAAFNEKHGGTFYSFYHQTDLFIILNSTKKDRSISSDQVDYLKRILNSSTNSAKRVFIFIHELIWNSHIKYRGVMSNSRSRYDQMVNYSNFWDEIFPILSTDQDRKYYLIAGDVGGNTDAISAFYDTRGNVTFVASGMGEVEDENYLKVNVLEDTVRFTFIPLNEEIIMLPVRFYNVPEKPDTIFGPIEIDPGMVEINYQSGEIFNATSYRWILPDKTSGASSASSILVDFGTGYEYDTIAVCAVNKGFGESEPFKIPIKAEGYNQIPLNSQLPSLEMSFSVSNHTIDIKFKSQKRQSVTLSVFDLQGKCFLTENFNLNEGLSTRELIFHSEYFGILLFSLSNGSIQQTDKVFIK